MYILYIRIRNFFLVQWFNKYAYQKAVPTLLCSSGCKAKVFICMHIHCTKVTDESHVCIKKLLLLLCSSILGLQFVLWCEWVNDWNKQISGSISGTCIKRRWYIYSSLIVTDRHSTIISRTKILSYNREWGSSVAEHKTEPLCQCYCDREQRLQQSAFASWKTNKYSPAQLHVCNCDLWYHTML